MEESEYLNIYQLEDIHWWYRGTHSLIVSCIKKFSLKKNPKVCDAGCGTGGLLKMLKREGFLNSYGFDASSHAIGQLRKRKEVSRRVWQGGVEELPLQDSSFDVITSIDVLYHKNVHKEEEALKEFFRVLKPRGICILQLPAFEFLRGSHDAVIMTRKRYSIGEVEKCVKETGFKIELCSYRNAWFFPVMSLWRVLSKHRLRRKKIYTTSDLFRLPKVINNLFYSIVTLENYLLDKVHFPFGTSIFCIVRKE